MSWINGYENVVRAYVDDPNAVAVAKALVGAPYFTSRVMRDDVDETVKLGLNQMLVDFTIGLAENPFWQKNSTFLMPVYVVALSTWLASFDFIIKGTTEKDQMALISARNTLADVAVAVLHCHKGPAEVQRTGNQMRQRIVDLGDVAIG
jgi:hypothetical protein